MTKNRPVSETSADPSKSAQPRNPHTSDHLANERTFLAWIRTSISVIGLGFVVAKFSVWLRELSARLNEPIQAHHTGLSLPMGVGMMTIGGLFAIMAAWRYRRVRQAIENGADASDERTVVVVTLLILAIARGARRVYAGDAIIGCIAPALAGGLARRFAKAKFRVYEQSASKLGGYTGRRVIGVPR